jgi:imidazolonepropionase-like amidohydrolase
VLIVDGTIAAVGGFSCVAGTEVDEVEAGGDTLLPGLIDSLDRAGDLDSRARDEARADAVAFGVTTLVAASAPPGAAPGATGDPTASARGERHEAGGAAERALAQIVPSPRPIADASTLAAAQAAVAGGAAGLAHLFVDELPPEALFDAIASQGVFVIPTLGHMQMECEIPVGRQVLSDPHLGPRLSEGARALLSKGRGGRLGPRRLNCYTLAQQEMRMLRGRATVLAGTDAPGPGVAHGASLHRELELLAFAGLAPIEALRAATSAPAVAFGLSDRGRIAPGMRADVVLVEGDPTENILSTRAIVRVYQNGLRAF